MRLTGDCTGFAMSLLWSLMVLIDLRCVKLQVRISHSETRACCVHPYR